MRVITLTTDFGSRDWFVGTMKGVIARLVPEANVIDITHEVAPGDVRGGAFALAAAVPYFPEGTIHVAVVDPGVGSHRRAIALRTNDAFFLGPDNGVLSWAVRDAQLEDVREISNDDWFLQPVSRTFHGRDVFAPVAARLAGGAAFSAVGESISDFLRISWPAIVHDGQRITGEVVYVDRFGNAITNVPAEALPLEAAAKGAVRLRCAGIDVCLRAYYAAANPNEVLAVASSSGLLELAINGGSFAQRYFVKEGAIVEAVW
ncbi:MAG TPA: SAM-dependent chlorinase/fluorinase [Chthoniobacterales bacterium]